MGKRLDKNKLPCKFARHDFDLVPIPFGSGNCQMPCFECVYEGDIKIPNDLTCNEDNTCPAYEPVPTFICPKHDKEYYDYCGQCEAEAFEPINLF